MAHVLTGWMFFLSPTNSVKARRKFSAVALPYPFVYHWTPEGGASLRFYQLFMHCVYFTLSTHSFLD